jgi:hypothetical protein
LQPPQNLRSQDDISREFKISSLVKETDMKSSPNSSSCGSFRSPCQTCSSSTLAEDATSRSQRLIDPVSLVHRVLHSDGSDMDKSNSSISSVQTGADTAIFTIPSNQEAACDQATDDYIPLPLEEDVFVGVDDLFGLVEDENHSSESKGSSDSEDCNNFCQACVRKEDGCHPPMVSSKLRSDIERRKSVFSRIVKANEVFNQRKRSKTTSFPQRSTGSFNPLFQMKKQRRAQKKRPYPCQNVRTLDHPSSDRLGGVQALDNSFVWSDKRSTKFSVGAEDRNKWDASTKEPARDDTCRKLFVLKGGAKWDKSYDRELNTSQLISVVQERREVSVKEESTPSLNFKRCAKGLKVEGGNQDFDYEDVVEAGQKTRSAMAPFHKEHPSDTALIFKGTKTMDILATSDGNCKENSTSLASRDTHTQLGRPYLETKVLLQQQKSIEGFFAYGEGETPLVLASSRSTGSLTESLRDRKTLLNDECHVDADQLRTERYIQEKLNQSVSTCVGVVNDDKASDFLPNQNEDCGNKRSLPSDGIDKLVASCCLETEMPLLQKQTTYIQSFSGVTRDDKMLVPKISKVVFPKVDTDCVYLGSDYREEVCRIVRSCHEVIPSDSSAVLESCGPLSNLPTLHGGSADNNSSLDETSEHVSTGHEDIVMLPQDKHYHSCCSDTSSVLEYISMDTCTGDDSANKNYSDQKDGEVLCSVTDSKDHVSITNTSSSGRSQSYARADDHECRKLILLNEEQCQNFQNTPELAHENSVDSFAIPAKGCGSKSDTSAGGTSDQQVTDVLGMNSDSRTSFVNDPTPALGSKNVEAYAEQPILQQDLGKQLRHCEYPSANPTCGTGWKDLTQQSIDVTQ